ncbi:MAG: tyrosine recombinase [Clostridia bacterium]|nr:tyrosine recombinase [Clostridia bacterium]
MVDYLPGFIDYLGNLKSSSVNTRDSYVRDVRLFLEYASSNGYESAEEIEENLIENYVTHLKELGRSNTTISRNVSSIRCFYKYLIFDGITDFNPAKNLKLDKSQKKLPQILTAEEIDRLLAQPVLSEPKGCRDKAMLELLYASGIRVSELINLDIDDVNLQTSTICCKSHKGIRTIPIYTGAVVAISDYIYRMRRLLVDSPENKALFVNLNGSRLTRQGFWKIIKGYAVSAGITTELTPHTLRHSFAMHLLENGADVKDLQTIMGHADISSTQIYVQMLDSHIKAVYDETHPKSENKRV